MRQNAFLVRMKWETTKFWFTQCYCGCSLKNYLLIHIHSYTIFFFQEKKLEKPRYSENVITSNLYNADSIGAKRSVRFIEMSAFQRFFLRQFERKANQSVPCHTVHLIEVLALQCVRFIEIPLYSTAFLLDNVKLTEVL